MSQGMAFHLHKARKEVTLNLTPLIDVLFLLLIFFMITGTFKRAGELELQLPESSTSVPAGTDREPHQVELVLTEEGLLLLDGVAVDIRQLKRQLEGILSEDARSRVMIKAEKGVDHGDVVRLLDIVRDAGFRGVGIGTQIPPIHD